MKYIFLPLYKVVLWLGKVIRNIGYFIWYFKKRPMQYIENDTSIRNKERRSNGIVGIISVLVTLIGSFSGVIWGSSSTDISNLEKKVSHSFSRMEDLEYITGNNTYFLQGDLSANTKLRGEAKLLSAQLRAQIDFYQNMKLGALFDANDVKTFGLAAYYEYWEYIQHFKDFKSRTLKYLNENNDPESKDIFIYFSPRLMSYHYIVESVSASYLIKLDKRIKEIEKIEATEENYTKLEKEFETLFKDADFIILASYIIQYIDLVYECLVEVELSEKYSDYKPANNNYNYIPQIEQYRP